MGRLDEFRRLSKEIEQVQGLIEQNKEQKRELLKRGKELRARLQDLKEKRRKALFDTLK